MTGRNDRSCAYTGDSMKRLLQNRSASYRDLARIEISRVGVRTAAGR